MGKKTIAIDFDATMHSYDKGWHDGTAYGEMIEGTREAIIQLAKTHRLIVFSARVCADKSGKLNHRQVGFVREWLKRNDVAQYFSDITCIKTADIQAIIDDRAVHFDGNWKKALQELKKIKGL